MLKRGFWALFIFILLIIGSSNTVFAQKNSSFDEFSDARLETSAGTTPDSLFYFLDEFFDNFGDDINVKEEKVAEIKVMIETGNLEAARISLDKYYQYADYLEKEISPDSTEEAKKSAAAIRNTLTKLEEQLQDADKKEFVDEVLKKEDLIVTSAEIADKIKELCEQLSALDPVEYSRVCTTSENAPDWRKKLDRKLTEEQRQEAIKFGEIMSQCFKTSGQECKCEEIPFAEFAEMCSIAAPLAVRCEVQGDESACEKLDNLEMPELPPHLQDVFDSLEGDVSEAQFDLHLPKECRDAGATNPKECSRVMIETHAPEECRQTLIEANVQNEREAREICEKIMFELNAPEECVEKGLTNPKECGKLMFQLNAPKECLDAGLTGESRSDEKKCREIMEQQRQGEGPEGFRGPRGGFGGANCHGIQNPEERLKCYDGAAGGAQEYRNNYEERSMETQDAQRQCAESCSSQGGAWDFSNGQCQCRFPERSDDGQFKEPQQGQEFTEPSTTPSTEGQTVSGETTPTAEPSPEGTVTGAFIFEDNNFIKYFYK